MRIHPSVMVSVAIWVIGMPPAHAQSCPPDCGTDGLVLGVVAPGTGPLAAFGRQAVKPVEIAIRELNAAGGVLGTQVRMAAGNDRCDPGAAVSVAKRQVEQDKVRAVIGPVCPPAAAAAAPIYADAGVVQILPTVPMIEEGRQAFEKMFRMVATDDQEALSLDDYMVREHNGKKLTVVYTDAYYRRPIIETMMRGLPPAMQKSAQFEPLLDNTSAYDRLADKIARSAPDVIYLALDNNMVLEVVTKLRKAGIKSLLIGGQRLLSQDFWLSARDAAEGIYVIAPIESLDDPEFGKAIGFMREANVVPDLVALNSYAAVQTWAEAVRRAGSGDAARVIEALRTGEFKTAVGSVAFDAKGSRRGIRYSVLAWQGSRLRPHVPAKP